MPVFFVRYSIYYNLIKKLRIRIVRYFYRAATSSIITFKSS
nr:MAG TPA: hypothetical protein [Caudoviricetes sp.]